MNMIEIVGGVILLLSCLVVIVSVVLQEGKGGLGSLGASSADSFFDRNIGRTRNATLIRATKVAGITLFAVTLVILAAGIYF